MDSGIADSLSASFHDAALLPDASLADVPADAGLLDAGMAVAHSVAEQGMAVGTFDIALWSALLLVIGGYAHALLSKWSGGILRRKEVANELDSAWVRDRLNKIESILAENSWSSSKLHRIDDSLGELHGKLDYALAEYLLKAEDEDE